ncbi:unnamed protein product [Closterium sp. Naga37s-1]|nr:unnamed protein product [Closterium sp. Naga37s-1]
MHSPRPYSPAFPSFPTLPVGPPGEQRGRWRRHTRWWVSHVACCLCPHNSPLSAAFSLPTPPSRPPRGATGQVVATYETVGVRFDSPVPGGHSLSGLCDGGHGHICYASELLLEESSSSVKECAATVALMQWQESSKGLGK